MRVHAHSRGTAGYTDFRTARRKYQRIRIRQWPSTYMDTERREKKRKWLSCHGQNQWCQLCSFVLSMLQKLTELKMENKKRIEFGAFISMARFTRDSFRLFGFVCFGPLGLVRLTRGGYFPRHAQRRRRAGNG